MLIGPLVMTTACRVSCAHISDGWDSPQIQRVDVNMLSKSELMLPMSLGLLFRMDVISVLQAVYIINFALEWCLV